MIKKMIKNWKTKRRLNKYGEVLLYEAKADGATYKAYKKGDIFTLYKEYEHSEYYLGSVKSETKAKDLCEYFKEEWNEYYNVKED